MTNPPQQSRPNLSEHRLAAYECIVNGSAVKQGKRVAGWYRMFDEERLKLEIMPKLAEYAKEGRPYPFLVTSYMLEGKTDVLVEWSATRRRVVGAKFRPRQQRTNHRNEAVVYSATDYRLLKD